MSRYHLKDTVSGHKTLVFSGEREIKLHSAYDPVKESERSVSSFETGRASIILVSGLGLGYHVDALNSKYPDKDILVLEHDRDVIKLAEKINPRLLKRITVITGETDLPVIFEEVSLSGFRGISHYIHRPSYLLHREFYDGIADNIKQYLSSKVSDLLTRFEFEEKWVDNIFSNIYHLFSAGRAGDLFGKFRGYPGIIVSAGPSLRKNARLLNMIRDRALIVCVDTAVKALEKNGVVPHIVMTLDAQKHSIKHFLGLKNQSPALLADIVSYPAILRKYTGKKFISTTSKYYTGTGNVSIRETTPAMDWLEKYIRPIGDIQSGGSVATSAFDLLINLGCDPVILVGQDLAYTGREIHSSGTHHNDDWLQKINRFLNLDTINQNVIRKRKIKYVASYGGSGNVISDFVLDLYRGWFEDSAGKVKNEVINSTEGGARIKNTREKSLDQVIKDAPEQEKTPEMILDTCKVLPEHQNKGKLKQTLENTLGQLKELKIHAEAGLEENEKPDILKIINKYDLMPLLNPYFRKSEAYVTRHGISGKDAENILYRNIIQAHNKLVPLIARSIKNLSKL